MRTISHLDFCNYDAGIFRDRNIVVTYYCNKCYVRSTIAHQPVRCHLGRRACCGIGTIHAAPDILLSKRPASPYTIGAMSIEPLETAEAQDYPTVVQLSVFLEDRVGELLRLTKLFTRTDIRIWGLMVVNSVDCAIVRMVVDAPEEARLLLVDNRFPVNETEIVVVRLPHGKRAMLNVWAGVLSAEINVYYTYALLGHSHGDPTIAIQTDSPAMACEALTRRGFDVLSEADLISERNE